MPPPRPLCPPGVEWSGAHRPNEPRQTCPTTEATHRRLSAGLPVRTACWVCLNGCLRACYSLFSPGSSRMLPLPLLHPLRLLQCAVITKARRHKKKIEALALLLLHLCHAEMTEQSFIHPSSARRAAKNHEGCSSRVTRLPCAMGKETGEGESFCFLRRGLRVCFRAAARVRART